MESETKKVQRISIEEMLDIFSYYLGKPETDRLKEIYRKYGDFNDLKTVLIASGVRLIAVHRRGKAELAKTQKALQLDWCKEDKHAHDRD